jgi:hypothetical protein
MPSLEAGNVSNRDVDYSSYEYQQVSFRPQVEGPDDDTTFIGFTNTDLLSTIGGLDSNEVAELVGFHREVTIQLRDFQSDASVVQGAFDLEFAFGANLDSATDVISTFQNRDGEVTEIDSQNVNQDILVGGTNAYVKDEVFDFGSFCYQPTSVSIEGNEGVGGTGSGSPAVLERDFMMRQSLGAGPVLDSADEISLAFAIEKDNAEVGELELVANYHLIWDVATVDDAGRRFGIPG